MGDIAMRLGTQIRVLRKRGGLSQAALGAPYFTRAHVSAIETGKITPSFKTLVHFSRTLGVALREVIPPDL
jgi:transcriptional regulator with XRE-family HTH domain